MYSDGFMVAFGCFIKLTLATCFMPVLVWILIYRKLRSKNNNWLSNWIFD